MQIVGIPLRAIDSIAAIALNVAWFVLQASPLTKVKHIGASASGAVNVLRRLTQLNPVDGSVVVAVVVVVAGVGRGSGSEVGEQYSSCCGGGGGGGGRRRRRRRRRPSSSSSSSSSSTSRRGGGGGGGSSGSTEPGPEI